MTNTVEYICDAAGQKVAVIVPIDLWQEIMSEKETAYLLSSPNMKERLLIVRERTPEEIAQQAQAIRDMFAEWDREYDAEEQRETFAYLQEALSNN